MEVAELEAEYFVEIEGIAILMDWIPEWLAA